MISVCLPTKNAGPRLASALDAWRGQRVGDPVELVVVDSGSRDDTLAQCRAAGARVASIPPESFNHGDTRNLLAQMARGDLLVFTVQDAVPADEQVLRELTEPLQQQPELAGVCGRQVASPDADFVGRWEATQLGKKVGLERRCKQLTSWEEFLSWDFLRRFESVSFDNVCSAIPRRVWEETPFSRIDFGEDLDWAVRVLRRGGALLFNPAARVFHSHCRPPLAWMQRYFVGRRRTNHILQMPAEHSSLDDAGVKTAVLQFDARVAGFLEGGWRQRVVPALPGVLDWLVPEKLRRPLRAVALRELPSVVNWRLGTRPLLGFGRLWHQVKQCNGAVPAEQAPLVARQLEAIVLGDFLGSYYHTCELQHRLSPRLTDLGQWLTVPASDGQLSPDGPERGLEAFFSLLRTS